MRVVGYGQKKKLRFFFKYKFFLNVNKSIRLLIITGNELLRITLANMYRQLLYLAEQIGSVKQ